MMQRLRTISVSGLLLAAALVLGSASGAQSADAETDSYRRIMDIEAGVGVYTSFGNDSDAYLEDGWYGVGSAAVQIVDCLDFEFGLGVGQSDDTGKTDRVDTLDPDNSREKKGNSRTWVNGFGGLRWYLLGKKPEDRARFFMSAGGSAMSNYKSSEVRGAFYIGPGVRLRAGDHSGLVLRLPFFIVASETESSLLIPTLSWFFQF